MKHKLIFPAFLTVVALSYAAFVFVFALGISTREKLVSPFVDFLICFFSVTAAMVGVVHYASFALIAQRGVRLYFGVLYCYKNIDFSAIKSVKQIGNPYHRKYPDSGIEIKYIAKNGETDTALFAVKDAADFVTRVNAKIAAV